MNITENTNYVMHKLSPNDGMDVYEMLQRIGRAENHFQNPAHGMTFQQYKDWLMEQNHWSRGELLPEGYSPETTYWLYAEDKPVAYGKIRHQLNENSRSVGGNIGYAVDPLYRGKGIATIILGKLIQIANDMGIEEKLLSAEKFNYASKRVIEKNNGYVFKENDLRWYFHIRDNK